MRRGRRVYNQTSVFSQQHFSLQPNSDIGVQSILKGQHQPLRTAHAMSLWISLDFSENCPETGRGAAHHVIYLESGPTHVVPWFQNDSRLQQSLLSVENLSPCCVGGMKGWDCTSRLVCTETLSHCVHLRSWSLASTTGLVWHQGNLRAALYCYFTSPHTVFVLNDVLCDLVVFAEMMKARAWCAVLCDSYLLLEMRYYFSPKFPKRQQQL